MKQLFKVVDSSKKTLTSVGSFESKQDAKKLRNQKNENLKEPIYVVSRGKDHWRGESFFGTKREDDE